MDGAFGLVGLAGLRVIVILSNLTTVNLRRVYTWL